jgi:hypothetical protein
MNPYLQQVAPQAMQQDIYGQAPMMDTTSRQLALDAANKQGAQLGQQALGINKNFMQGIDPMKLGMALRQMNPADQFGSSGMSSGMSNGGVTGNVYDANGQLLTTGNTAPPAATWNQAFGGTGGMGS